MFRSRIATAVLAGTLSVASFSMAHAAETEMTPSKAPAGAYVLDDQHASVVGRIDHLGLSQFKIEFTDIDADFRYDPKKPYASKVKVTIDPASVSTGVEKLDKELTGKKYFNVAKYPEITFVSDKITKTKAGKGTMTGELTFMGVTKPISMDIDYNGYAKAWGADKLGFSATTTITRSDYGLNTLVGPIGDNVALTVEVEFTRQ